MAPSSTAPVPGTPTSADRARDLGISREAALLYASSDVIDLHLDSFIWARALGFDIRERREPLFGRFLWGHADLPRVVEAGITGATWVITTNPLRSSTARARAFRSNLSALCELLASSSDDSVRVVRNHADYLAARRDGKHAAFIGIQGGNAVDADFSALDGEGPQTVLRVTLLHLTRSPLGAPSAPRWLHSEAGLTPRGHELVQALDARRIFVDLAHVNRKGFFDALQAHDRTLPALVTHTGVSAVHAHWRNLDDAQLRAIAETGGCVGIMYHAPYLGGGWFGGNAELVFRHIEHAVRVAGEDHVALGSDWDGAIVPPSDLGSCADLPRLVQVMLDHGWAPERIRKVLGLNFLRALHELRG